MLGDGGVVLGASFAITTHGYFTPVPCFCKCDFDHLKWKKTQSVCWFAIISL